MHAANDKDNINIKPLSIQSLISAQEKHTNFHQLAEDADALGSQYFYNESVIPSRLVWLDDATQNVVLMFLRAMVLAHEHHSTTSDHSDARKPYDTIRKPYYWCYITNDIYNYAERC